MNRLMLPAAAVAAAAAIVTAGCASAGASGPGSLDGAAAIVPANAVAFVAASTDLSSSEWHGVGKQFMTQFKSLAPALGGEIDVAVLPSKDIVGFTQPQDSAKLTALATKQGAQTRVIGGWTAIAKTGAALDTVSSATSHLADNNLFVEAMSRLPSGALVRAYANAQEAQTLLSSIPGQLETSMAPAGVHYRVVKSSQSLSRVAVGTTGFRWVAAALTSTSDGLKLEAFARTGGLTATSAPRYIVHPTAPYASVLVDEIPSGVLAVVDLQVSSGMFENMGTLPAPLVKFFGVKNATSLPNQLDTLLGGETAIYVKPSLPIPEVTLVTQPTDTVAASQALDAILAELPSKSMFSGVKLYRKTMGGQFVVSTTQQGLSDFSGGTGPRLSADPSFLAAKAQSGMGATTTGFVYANVKDALPLLSLAGVKLPAGLPSFGTFMAYGGQTDTESSLTAFLGVSTS
jgi:hypothetical protein